MWDFISIFFSEIRIKNYAFPQISSPTQKMCGYIAIALFTLKIVKNNPSHIAAIRVALLHTEGVAERLYIYSSDIFINYLLTFRSFLMS